MEKEELLSKIREQIGNTSLSERTLSDFAASMLPYVPESDTDAFIASQVSFLKSLGGNFSRDVAEAVRKIRSDEETKQKPSNEGTETGNSGGDDVIALMRQEISELKDSLSRSLAEKERERKVSDVRKGLEERIRKQTGSSSNGYLLEKSLVGIDYSGDVSALIDQAEKEYNRGIKEVFSDSGAPRGGIGGYGGKADDKFLDDFIEKRLDGLGGFKSSQE